MVRGLSDQNAALRWDESGASAHVSCFLAEEAKLNEFAVIGFEKELEKKLTEVLPAQETESGGGKRLIVDCYSSMGKLTVSAEKTSIETNAVGIGGDFFLFHPLQLLSGAYFSGNDLMQDAVILDENAAWQLFGSYDIEGKRVMIGGVPHYISGVVRQEKSRFAERAGLSGSMVYVSYTTLTAQGSVSDIQCMEVLAPNPVRHFVYHTLQEKLGVKEEYRVLVENSSRYTAQSLLPVILEFGSRSMQNTAVRFPYWENVARGYEDVLALLLLLRCFLLVFSGSILLVFLIWLWRHRNFSMKDIRNWLEDWKERRK